MHTDLRRPKLSAGFVCAVAFAAMFAGNAAVAAGKTVKLSATRQQVSAACQANGGVEYGTGASSGNYGCVTDNAWVDCNDKGKCEGGRAKTVVNGRPGTANDNDLLQTIE